MPHTTYSGAPKRDWKSVDCGSAIGGVGIELPISHGEHFMKIRVQLAWPTFGLLALSCILASAQTANPPKAAVQPARPIAPTARAMPPDQKAFNDARAMTDPEK